MTRVSEEDRFDDEFEHRRPREHTGGVRDAGARELARGRGELARGAGNWRGGAGNWRGGDRASPAQPPPRPEGAYASRVPAYISSIRCLYSRSTTGRFSFRLGVISPCSTSRSRGSSRNFLIVCHF